MTLRPLRSGLLACSFLVAASGAALFPSLALADGWVAAASEIEGSVRAGSSTKPLYAGDTAEITGSRMVPGQTVQFMHGTQLLSDAPVTVGDDGKFSASVEVPADSDAGLHPLIVIAANPPAVEIVDLKISQDVPLSGEDRFEITTGAVADRAYQVAMSDDGKIFVASGRGDSGPAIVRLDAETMAEDGRAEIPNDMKGEKFGAFGIAYDPTHQRVWATSTPTGNAVIYDADTLTPVKTLPEDSIGHPRDVVIDAAAGRAYINDAMTGNVHVYDTDTLEQLEPMLFTTETGKEVFATMSLDLDADQMRLYSVSLETSWVGWLDLKTGESHSFEVKAIKGGAGIAHDPETGRMFIVGQYSDNLVVLDDTGEMLAETDIGAGALSVAFDASTGQVYVASRGAGTLTVLDVDGNITANLPFGDAPNHVLADGNGAVYGVSMYGAKDDDDAAGSVSRISAK